MNKIVFLTFLVILGTTVGPVVSKAYTKCELAKRLKDLGVNSIAEWVCIAKWESNYNSNSKGCNTNGSCDYGIFQINSKYWCQGEGTISNDCNINCSSLLNDVTQTDINCIRVIHARHGFDAWVGWKNNCKGKNLSEYTSGCAL